jgi:hypothetical protein
MLQETKCTDRGKEATGHAITVMNSVERQRQNIQVQNSVDTSIESSKLSRVNER